MTSSPNPRYWLEAALAIGAGLAVAVLVAVSWPIAFGLISVGVVVLLVLGIVWHRFPRPVVRMVTVALALRLALVALSYAIALPDSGADAIFFEEQGWELAGEGWDRLETALWKAPSGGGRADNTYSALIGVVYWAFGVRSLLAIQAINVLLGTLIVLNVYRGAALLWGHRAAMRAGWLAAVLPALILYSALTMREAAVAYLLTVAGLKLIDWSQNGRPLTLAAGMLAGVGAAIFHSGAIAATLAMIVLAIFAPLRTSARIGPGEVRLRRLLGVATLCVAAYFMFELGIGLEKFNRTGFDIESIGARQAHGARGDAAYLPGLTLGSWVDALWQGPIRVVYFYFTPFPWQITTSFQAVGFIDSTAYLLLWGGLARRLGQVMRNPSARNLLAMVAALSIVYALGTSNFGTGIRHRQKILPLIVVLGGVLFTPRDRPKRSSPEAVRARLVPASRL